MSTVGSPTLRDIDGITRINLVEQEDVEVSFGVNSILATTSLNLIPSSSTVHDARIVAAVDTEDQSESYRVVLTGAPPALSHIGELVNAEIHSFTDELNNAGSLRVEVGQDEALLDDIVELETEMQVWIGRRRMWLGVVTRARGGSITARTLDFHFDHRFVGDANRRNWLRNGDFRAQGPGGLSGEPSHWSPGNENTYPGSTRIWRRQLVNEDGVRYLRLRENRVEKLWLRTEDDTPAPSEDSLLAYVIKEHFWPGGLPRSIPGSEDENGNKDVIRQENRSVLVTDYKTPQDVAIYISKNAHARWPYWEQRMGSPGLLRRYQRYRVIEGTSEGEGWEITNGSIPDDFIVGRDPLKFRQYAYTREQSFNQRIGQGFRVSTYDDRMRPGQTWVLRGYYRIPETPDLPPFQDRGAGFRLYKGRNSSANTVVEEWENIDLGTKPGIWHRFELEITIPHRIQNPGFAVYLYAPVGEIHWRGIGVFHRDSLIFETGRPWVNGAARWLVAHAQDPGFSKSDLRIGFSGALGVGGRTDQPFYHDEHQQINDALDSLGLIRRFDPMTRRLQSWPSRGIADDRGDVLIDETVASEVEIIPDGSDATSAVIAMSSYSGPAREEGFARDPGAFGGVTYESVIGSEEPTTESLDRVAESNLSTTLPTLVVAHCPVDKLPLNLAAGNVIRMAVTDGTREFRGHAMISKLEWLPGPNQVRVEANTLE